MNPSPPPVTPDDIERVNLVIGLTVETLRVTGIYLQPYMPNKANHILDFLGVDEDKRDWAHSRVGGDGSYGLPKCDLGRGIAGVIFPPIPET
jgi:methionyl-tRNA synthetase